MAEPITGEETGPATMDRKIEEQTKKSFDDAYSEFLKKEQEKAESEMKGRAVAQFDEVRKLGFATAKDIDDKIEIIFSKFIKEVEQMREENVKLREWVMRAKAQGLNTGKLEEERPIESVLKSFERPFLKDMKR